MFDDSHNHGLEMERRGDRIREGSRKGMGERCIEHGAWESIEHCQYIIYLLKRIFHEV